jgi:hypothetical protein
LNKKVLLGPTILATILIIAMVSSIPAVLAVFQSDHNSDMQIYPMHMGQQRYMPHQYGPHGGYQDQGWEHNGWEGCPGMNYGHNTPYGEKYTQPGSWSYND